MSLTPSARSLSRFWTRMPRFSRCMLIQPWKVCCASHDDGDDETMETMTIDKFRCDSGDVW